MGALSKWKDKGFVSVTNRFVFQVRAGRSVSGPKESSMSLEREGKSELFAEVTVGDVLPQICIVSPCFNEKDSVMLFYQALAQNVADLREFAFCFLFVDDGSTDGTLDVLNSIAARDSRVLVYSLSRNFGHQIAVSAGIDVAKGAAVIVMDSDMQHPPELIPRLLTEWKSGCDVVSTIRDSTERIAFGKRLSGALFYWLINLSSKTKIVPNAADFFLLSATAHAAIKRMPERHRFIRGMVSWIGFNRGFVHFQAPARIAGESKYTLSKMVSLAADAAFSFSSAPVKLASRVGAVTVAAGFVYLFYVIVRQLWIGDLVTGWASLMCVLLILGGGQLLFIGIIGEYLARIFDEGKARPLYFFKQSP